MKKAFSLFLLSFILVGCTIQPPTDQPQTQTQQSALAQEDTIATKSGIISGNIYENKTYGFKFILPASSELSGDQGQKPVENFDPIHAVSLYLGGSMNTIIYVFRMDADREELKDIKNGTNYYGYKRGSLADGTDYWQSGPSVGTADALFLTTVIYGKSYIYEISTSDENKSKNFTSKHAEIVNGFRVE